MLIGANLKRLLPTAQLAYLSQLDENGKEEYADSLQELEEQLQALPRIYGQQDRPTEQQIVYAHYFHGSTDWYITEWDGAGEFFGYTILNGDTANAELGYISVKELLTYRNPGLYNMGVDLDFHWKTRTLGEVMLERGVISKLKPVSMPKKLAGTHSVPADQNMHSQEDEERNPMLQDAFFKNHPEKILGTVTQKKRGDRGKDVFEEIITGTLEEALAKIKVPVIDRYASTNSASNIHTQQVKKEAAQEVKKQLTKAELINKVIASNAMDKKALKEKAASIKAARPEELVFDAMAIYRQYNGQINQAEREAFMVAYPEHKVSLLFAGPMANSIQDLLAQGLLMVEPVFTNKRNTDVSAANLSFRLEYRYLFLSGDINQKLYALDQARTAFVEKYSQAQYELQRNTLEKSRPLRKRIDAVDENDLIVMMPHAETAKNFYISEVAATAGFELFEKKSLHHAFIEYLQRAAPGEAFKLSTREEVLSYVKNTRKQLSKREQEQLEDDIQKKELQETKKRNAKITGDALFQKFLSEALTEIDKQVLNEEWNRKYNGVVEPDLSKLPVVFRFSQVFKKGAPLALTDTQRNGIAFFEFKKSALLGYDVGVGKTLSAIAAISNAFETGRAKRALLVVPDATIKKWKYELVGGPDAKDKSWIYGAVPHLQVFEYGNFNTDIVYREVKEYTEQEHEIIKMHEAVKRELNKFIAKPDRLLLSALLETVAGITTTNGFNGAFTGIVGEVKKVIAHVLGLEEPQQQAAGALGLAELITTLKTKVLDEKNIHIYTLGKVKPLPENAIVLLNYSGLTSLGLGFDGREGFRKRMFDILSQGELEVKDQASLIKMIDKAIGQSMRDTKVIVEDLGIDFFCIDEAHNMKKVFTAVKGESKGEVTRDGSLSRESSRYDLSSGEPSNQAISAFAISQYVQQTTNGKNVLMLSATPFTNSPLEIYSMLALTNYQRLEEQGKNNLKDFFDTYIKEEAQIVINASGRPEIKPVIVGFHNLSQLKQMMYDIIDYKTGEDAMVIRPEVISIPDTSKDKKYGGVDTFLQMTPLQKLYMQKIQRYIDGTESLQEICEDAWNNDRRSEYTSEYLKKIDQTDSNEPESVRILRSLSFGKMLALSPYLFACNDLPVPTAKEYVETSPKLKYTIECIRSTKEWHEARGERMSGQVIYMDIGTRYFGLIKEYLCQQVGFKSTEVEILEGEVPKAKKEKVKDAFLRGDVLIIIGSSTIKEGIDLQNRSTNLFILSPDWNPTDYNQVRGRIHRQGNEFAYVRIVLVLMADSVDVFIFQKLQEKTLRLKELLDRGNRKSQLDLDDMNPEEVKESLITDPVTRSMMQLKREGKELDLKVITIQNELLRLKDLMQNHDSFSILYPKLVSIINVFNKGNAAMRKRKDKEEWQQKLGAWIEAGKNRADYKNFNEAGEAYQADEFDPSTLSKDYVERVNNRATWVLRIYRTDFMEPEMAAIPEATGIAAHNFITVYQELMGSFREVKPQFMRGMEQLESMGMSIDALAQAIEEKQSALDEVEVKKKQLHTKEYFEKVVEANKASRETYLRSLKTLEERVADFASLNHYMQYKLDYAAKLKELKEATQGQAGQVFAMTEEVKAVEIAVSADEKQTKVIELEAEALELELELLELELLLLNHKWKKKAA
jgi:hypothetical protein